MKHFPKIHFKEIMTLAILACLITTVLFIGQKARSEGPASDQSQIYFYCLADPACTINFNCPSGRDCRCLDQGIAKVRFNRICKSQPEGEVSGTCENCGTFGEVPEDDKNCALYGSSGKWIGWCGCKIVCPPTPTPTPSLPKDCGQRDAGFCEGGSCDYTVEITNDFCVQTFDDRKRPICACVTPTPSSGTGSQTFQGQVNQPPDTPE